MTLNIIKLFIDAAPDSVRSVNNNGSMPLHWLCGNSSINGTTLVEIAELLIEKYPEAVQHVSNNGNLPIHIAAKAAKSPEFCQVLIEANPGSQRISDINGELPLHVACRYNSFAAVEYFYKLDPDTINHATTKGLYPIHCAMTRITNRNRLTGTVEIVQYLLDCDPNVKFQNWLGRMSLLHVAFRLTVHLLGDSNDSNTINAALEIIKTLYDAHPEAIEDKRFVRDTRRYHQQVQTFLNSELVYARQAKDRSLMTIPDDNGRLPLHTALQNNVRLGSIKLLVKGNPHAVQSPDTNSGVIPLHLACEHYADSARIRYLVGLDATSLEVVDKGGNTALHFACCGANYDAIALLLEKYDAVSTSKRPYEASY